MSTMTSSLNNIYLYSVLFIILKILTPSSAFLAVVPSRSSSASLFISLHNERLTSTEKKENVNNTVTNVYVTNEQQEEMERKLAWAKHTLLTVAASVMNVPVDVFTTPPMVDPKPPSNSLERSHRQKINNLLSKGYPNPLDGFQIPNEEIEMIHDINDSNGSSHNPSTYGEVTMLGARQLFHFMKMFKNQNDSDKNNVNVTETHPTLHFIDLGSGNGKLLVQAYLEIPDLKKVEGIELSSVRFNLAQKAWDEIKDEAHEIRHETRDLYRIKRAEQNVDAELNLIQGDLFQMDISTATHIYIASLCFTDEMMNALSDKIIKEGGCLRCIATLKPFPPTFEENSGLLKEARYVEMSWTKPRGMGGIVYFYSSEYEQQ